MDTLEGHYRDMCDIEFTIEKGRLWILQTRIGKRTAFAEWVMAYDMLERGPDRRGRRRCCASTRTAWRSCSSGGSRTPAPTPIARGLNASPGAATGEVVFTADDAESRAQDGARGRSWSAARRRPTTTTA